MTILLVPGSHPADGITGRGRAVLGPVGSRASGAVAVSGSGRAPLGPIRQTAAAVAAVLGRGVAAVLPLAGSARAVAAITGIGSARLANFGPAARAAAAVAGTGSATLADLGARGAGTLETIIIGRGRGTLTGLVGKGYGTVEPLPAVIPSVGDGADSVPVDGELDTLELAQVFMVWRQAKAGLGQLRPGEQTAAILARMNQAPPATNERTIARDDRDVLEAIQAFLALRRAA